MDYLSWQRRPHIASCKLFLTLLRAKLAVFAKCISGICEEAKNTKMGCFFSSILTTLKRPKKLIHGCLPKIWINPYIWQPPSYVLTTVWEDLALNAGTLPTIGIDPYFMANPFRCPDHRIGRGRGFECMWSIFLANDPYFWQSSAGHKKWPPLTQKWFFFHPDWFFSRVHALDICFFAKKNALILVSRALCRKKKRI